MLPTPPAGRPRVLGAFLLLVVYTFAFQGARGLWEPDEGRYTAIAIQMLHSGDVVVPAFNHDQPHLTKPPLTYWAIAGSLSAFGRTTWAARVPSAAAFVGTVVLVVLLGRRLVPGHPWLPGFVYALALLPIAGAAVVNTDTLLTFWETLAALGFVAAQQQTDPRRSRLWIVVMWAAFGLAFLTKGPPGLLPLAAFLGFALLARRPGLRSLVSPLGLLLFAGFAFGWFLLVGERIPGLIGRLWNDEVVHRIARGTHHRNSSWHGAFDIYVPTLLVGTFPWTWFLLRSLPRARSLWRRSYWHEALARDPEHVLLLLWCLVPLVVFVLARSRLAFYLLPLFVPFSILVARALTPDLERFGRRWRPALAGWAVFLIAARGASAWVPSHEDARAYAKSIAQSVSFPFQEIVFIDARPHYGLSLYFNVPVESVTLGPGRPWEGGPGREESLAEEIAESETRLFILSERHRERFLASATGLGLVPRSWGGRQKDLFYTVDVPPGSGASVLP